MHLTSEITELSYNFLKFCLMESQVLLITHVIYANSQSNYFIRKGMTSVARLQLEPELGVDLRLQIFRQNMIFFPGLFCYSNMNMQDPSLYLVQEYYNLFSLIFFPLNFVVLRTTRSSLQYENASEESQRQAISDMYSQKLNNSVFMAHNLCNYCCFSQFPLEVAFSPVVT